MKKFLLLILLSSSLGFLFGEDDLMSKLNAIMQSEMKKSEELESEKEKNRSEVDFISRKIKTNEKKRDVVLLTKDWIRDKLNLSHRAVIKDNNGVMTFDEGVAAETGQNFKYISYYNMVITVRDNYVDVTISSTSGVDKDAWPYIRKEFLKEIREYEDFLISEL